MKQYAKLASGGGGGVGGRGDAHCNQHSVWLPLQVAWMVGDGDQVEPGLKGRLQAWHPEAGVRQ